MVEAVWIILVVVTLIVTIITGRTLASKISKNGHVPAEARPRTVVLLPVDVKRQIEETESEIRKKTETVARIIAQKEGSPPPKKKTEVSTDPLNETSFMRAISAKVEEVKRISGVKS